MFGLFNLVSSHGQPPSIFCKGMPIQDSLLLVNFFDTLDLGIQSSNKEKVAALCEFPINYVESSQGGKLSLKALSLTKKSFYKSEYNIFTDAILRKILKQYLSKKIKSFSPIYNDECHFDEVVMSYTFGENLQSHWLMFLKKENGKYKIRSIQVDK